MEENKKGQITLGQLGGIAITFIVIAITISLGADVLDQMQTNQEEGLGTGCNATNRSTCGADVNATQDGLDSLMELSGFLPTIALVVAAAVIIGVVVTFFSFRE